MGKIMSNDELCKLATGLRLTIESDAYELNKIIGYISRQNISINAKWRGGCSITFVMENCDINIGIIRSFSREYLVTTYLQIGAQMFTVVNGMIVEMSL